MNLNNPESFAKNFLNRFLHNGFGTLPKREIEILVMHLLLKDGVLRPEGRVDHHEISVKLRLPESRVRSLIYEVELKHGNAINIIDEIIHIIESDRYSISGTKVKISVHSPLVKQHIEYKIRKLNGVSDGSFGKHIISLELSTFQRLLEDLYGNQPLPDTIAAYISDQEEPDQTPAPQQHLISVAFGEFIRAFSAESGTMSARLLFDAINPVNFLREMFCKPINNSGSHT